MQSTRLKYANRALAINYFPAAGAQQHVVIAPALGVKQRFYHRFAQWLAEQGIAVTCFDYYGIGDSIDKPLSKIETDIIDWATLDLDNVLTWAREQLPSAELIWLGHSLGGQLLGLIPHPERIDRIVTVASGTGYWRQASSQVRRTSWLLWYLAIPLATPIAGYFPGKRLNMVGDMPAQAMRQRSRWCRSRNYLFDHLSTEQLKGYQRLTQSYHAFAISDDELLVENNVRALLQRYPNTQQKLTRLTPQQAGRRIGHFNIFKPTHQQTLWQKALLPAIKADQTTRLVTEES